MNQIHKSKIRPFYNTINEKDQLDLFNTQASKQESIILNWFRENKEKLVTPFEVWELLFDDNTPITSIRRAMTNLTKKGLINKTTVQKVEKFGKRNYCWKFSS